MPEFQHVRTGRKVEVGEGLAGRYRGSHRWREVDANPPSPVVVPSGTVAEIVAWATTDKRRAAALAVERAGKNRKSLIDKLS